jgi:thiol-disulfide isomerase/thioredoxin
MKIYKQSLPNHAQSNFYAIFPNLFAALGIKFTYKYLNNKLLFPSTSLHNIRNILQSYKIATLPVELGTLQLQEIPYPALAQIRNKDGEFFVVLQKIENEIITYIHTEKGIITEAITDFAKLWTGVTLLIEKNENSAEPNYKENKKQEIIENLRLPLLLLVLGLVIGYQAMQFTNMLSFAWLVTKLVGTILSVLLLLQSLNKNSLVAKLCSFNKKTDCNSLLTSPAATLFGVVTWAEIGFFYFCGSLCWLLFFNANLFIFNILAYLSLPFVAWSVWYQWKIAKIWCPLYLGVATILAIETSLSLFTFENKVIAITISQGFIFFSFFMVLVIYFFLKPFFVSATKVPKLQKELAIFKNNFDIFKSLLHQQKYINEETLPQQIILGNVEAPLTLVFVSNPDCPPCKAAKPKIDTLLEQFSEELKVVTVYTNVDKAWCNENQISFTPTFFIAGYQLPELYKVEDLQYFIAEMAEEIIV